MIYYQQHQTEESKYKAKVRSRKSFKDFKEQCRKECGGRDYITGKKLGKKWNFHHKDQRIENYENFIPDRFCCLNLQMHDVIHILYKYYEKDEAVLERLSKLLQDMKRMSND